VGTLALPFGQVALAIEMGATYGCVEWGRSRIRG
jgi:hypothetical protein